MSYMIINHYEQSALKGLPYLQQLTYLNGLKPYVDYQTEIIGINGTKDCCINTTIYQ